MAKRRLDQALVALGLCESREIAKRLILAGEVMVGGHVADKPATPIPDDAEIVVKERPKYVGRGGLKLEGALDAFAIDCTGFVCLDIGSSTGGFTDCLLQRGAAKVYAFDVGTNQLAWKLRSDARVISRERFNCRQLTADDLDERPDIIVIDVSFISLTKILPAAASVLKSDGRIICLIKPQFELRREQVGKGGIIRDPDLHDEAVRKIREFVKNDLEPFAVQQVIDSPIRGGEGNKEFLALIAEPTGP